MLDIRYIVGSLVITVALIAFAIRMFVPADTTTTSTATLKPRIEPSKIVVQPAPDPKKQTAAPVPQKQVTTPAAPAGDITGSIAEPKPAPKRIVQPKKKEPEFEWPFFKGFGQNWQQN